ncbi:hypothetical protein F511_41284 [Dorcoceras hygrometricum]|uniref:Uncharacterized protein n=1 Tax=Dorcoceras hygrometricum TaxID=472368 RepID=A0A2Z7BBK5_9LAMI|nr:hypothetical protein F511_41284 [Dorcoceras hygrometricum]
MKSRTIAAAPSPQPHAAAALCAPPPPPPPPRAAGKLFPANLDEENPSAPISSGLLVQADEGIPSPVVDLIDDIYRHLP